VVSGNVSFYNETNGLSIYPTPILGMVGLIEPAEQAMTQWFKAADDAILLLGTTREELGGTEYLRVVHNREQGAPPQLSLDEEKALQACILDLIGRGLVQSAHDCSDGGLAVALAECCVSHPSSWEGAPGSPAGPGSPPLPRPRHRFGAVVRLEPNGLRRDALLFGESQARAILSVKPEHVQQVLKAAAHQGVPAAEIGRVGGDRLVIEVESDRWGPGCRLDAGLDDLYDRWGRSIERAITSDE
jgi:phosphoribosylformylglycinamidine synthase subunit PurL